MTARLFYDNPYLQSFEASVIEMGTDTDHMPFVILDRTAFYPTGGGQPCDTGTLSGVEVLEVEESEGRIIHKLAQPLPSDTSQVEGKVDWQQRFDHMQQHAGQHLLSAAFEQLYDAETFGFHMGKETVTVDIARFPVSPIEIAAVEQLVNQIIFDNRSITAAFIDPAEISRLPLRKPPSVTENIRIVAVDDFDYSPCGGTHPSRTGAIGLVKVLAWEKYKAGTRVEFVCGSRAVAAMDKKQQLLRELGRLLGTGDNELFASASRLFHDRKELERTLQDAKQSLLEYEARELLERTRQVGSLRITLEVFENRTIQELQRLAGLLTKTPDRVALLASGGDKTSLVFAKGEKVSVSMTDLLKSVLPLIDGKGGGNASLAQGGGNASGNPRYLLDEALRLLTVQIETPHT